MKKLLGHFLCATLITGVAFNTPALAKNPITDKVFTADPAAIVHNGTVYLYTGHDEDTDNTFYKMNDWLLFTSTDMVNWQAHGPIMKVTDFKWAKQHAWAAHMVERDGKFYFYTSVYQHDKKGFAIGVATADTPFGPFKDARGSALITNDMTTHTKNDWDDIDPAVFIEENGEAYLFFGNLVPKYVKLKDNMIELDGEIKVLDLPHFTEALWLHKKGEYYYLSYASGFPETIHYAMSKSIHGPWEYKGLLNEIAGNSETNHQSIITFKGKDYFIYHNGAIQHDSAIGAGGRYRRSVAVDKLEYNPDGSIKRIIMTSEGITQAAK
ncbi:glycoside hydrolase family 43 protein [Thalassotalea sp. G2M2-11]|uniref:glycoside hydrolase family 43 protein n=1 Tax=Thalassotalea sp. G2M2-11 TaxID=2787627 RepID=UPI0019D1CFBA|nr:glycoside hydrolase family 43 protein [Thalassotalea sp. G2M2-11]